MRASEALSDSALAQLDRLARAWVAAWDREHAARSASDGPIDPVPLAATTRAVHAFHDAMHPREMLALVAEVRRLRAVADAAREWVAVAEGYAAAWADDPDGDDTDDAGCAEARAQRATKAALDALLDAPAGAALSPESRAALDRGLADARAGRVRVLDPARLVDEDADAPAGETKGGE